MHTLWSRAAQPRSLCLCPNCVSATRVAARRTTTATPKPKLPTGNAFTVFASSLAATASYVDSRIKDARRAQWDIVINEARAQVQATEAEQQRRLASLGYTGEEGAGEQQRADELAPSSGTFLEKVGGQYLCSETRADTWADVFSWAAQQDEARAASGFADWRGPSLSLLRTLSPKQLQELLSEGRMLRRFYGGPDCAALVDETATNGFTPKKIRTLEYSIAKLVLELLSHSSHTMQESNNTVGELLSTEVAVGGATSPKEESTIARSTSMTGVPGDLCTDQDWAPGKRHLQDAFQSEEDLSRRIADINSHIQTLHRSVIDARSEFFEDYESPPVPRYSAKFTGKTHEEQALNKSLHEILESMTTLKYSAPSISKICFNLLTSKTPPNIHSYNMLLVRFCHMDSKDLVEAVLTSMRESHIRPNEITHSTLLRYYTEKNNPALFTGYYLKMMGYNHGLALASPKQDIPPSVRHRYRFFGPDMRLAAELARMNDEVYEALIIGALQFFGAQAAMQFYRDMISEGWRSSAELLTAILKHCAHRFDWEGGAAVWEQIKTVAKVAHRASYELMLCLCHACGQRAVFDQILQNGIDEGVLPSDTQELLHHLKHQVDSAHLQHAKSSEIHKSGAAELKRAPVRSVKVEIDASVADEEIEVKGESVKEWKNLREKKMDTKKLMAIVEREMKHKSRRKSFMADRKKEGSEREWERFTSMVDEQEKGWKESVKQDLHNPGTCSHFCNSEKVSSRSPKIKTDKLALVESLAASDRLSTRSLMLET